MIRSRVLNVCPSLGFRSLSLQFGLRGWGSFFFDKECEHMVVILQATLWCASLSGWGVRFLGSERLRDVPLISKVSQLPLV